MRRGGSVVGDKDDVEENQLVAEIETVGCLSFNFFCDTSLPRAPVQHECIFWTQIIKIQYSPDMYLYTIVFFII
jgi:hypothetical protein